jgi:D-alanyl-D-alanine carboxypeptidase/D-alanyl-D-alanine-endopeptidase (penicillin-binding protein 4)
VKHILNKTVKVKHVLVVVFLPLVITVAVLTYITERNSSAPPKIVTKDTARQKPIVVKDTAKKVALDTSAMGLLMNYVDSINHAEQIFGGSWSFYLTDVDSGKSICQVNIDHGLSPASVMKVVTTGAALSLLGPDFRFSTVLQYDGKFDSIHKILNGNIYIHGGGDPSLGSETFGSSVDDVTKGWAMAIKHMGIDSIAGAIIGDAESFERDPVPNGWTWEDMQNNYGTGPGGLNIRENVFDMLISPNGKETTIKITPTIPGLKLYNQVVFNSAIEKSYAYVEGAPFQFERTAMGEISSIDKEQSPIPDPALFCAQSLKAMLKANGIGIRDSATTVRLLRLNRIKTDKNGTRKYITSTSSPALADLVYHTNQVSQNFYAESILRAISWKLSGFGSNSTSINLIYSFWKTHGIDLRGICMVDGCGLGRMNSITTHQLVEMLRVYAKDSNVFPTFYRSLPVAGESGTIKKLADGTEADGNLHAKSGTMARVKSYAGYVKTESGKMLCFAMIGNNTLWNEVELRDKFAKLFVLMARLP